MMGGGHVWRRGGGHVWQRGSCMVGGMCEGETATEVGGTHPTGIHSCSSKLLPKM